MADNENHRSESGSFLIAEVGNTTTSVNLYDVVAGSHRLVSYASAPTTASAPWSDVLVGVRQAIARISETIGRPLLTESGHLITPTTDTGAGVDQFAATLSVAPPFTSIVIGLLADASVASARRALHTIYATETDTFSMGDGRDEQVQINAILDQRPDLILVTGGTDTGEGGRLLGIVEMLELALTLSDSKPKPEIIFAGNRKVREHVSTTLGEFTRVHTAANVRPNLEREQLGDVMRIVGELYVQRQISAVAGVDELNDWSSYGLEATARTFGRMIDYFSALYEKRVWGLDLGSQSTTFAVSDSHQHRLSVRSDLGMGAPLATIFDKIPPSQVIQWLPNKIRPEELISFVRNKAIHASTVPMTEEDLGLEQALARAILRQTVLDASRNWGWSESAGQQRGPDLLVVGSFLGRSPRASQAALIILDALQPVGTFALTADPYGVLPALGLLAPHEPEATVRILEGGALVDLGWIVAPVGTVKAGQTALGIVVESEKQGRLELNVEWGKLEVLPLAPGETAKLKLEPGRGVDIGFGPGRGKTISIHGGTVGLIIDARGRPLRLPEDGSQRREQLREWQWDMGG